MSHPFHAWQRARQQQATDGATKDGLAAQIKALKAILSDMEEHGDDNIDEAGGGDYSQGDFSRLLKEAQRLLIAIDRGPRVPLAAAPVSAASIQLSTPLPFPGGGGPWPVVSGTSFLSTDEEAACLRDIRSGAVTTRFDVKNDDLRSAAVSPDGTVVVLGLWDQRWVACDATTGHVLFDNTDQVDWVTALAFSPDGKVLYSGGRDKLLAHAMPGGATVAALGDGDMFGGPASLGPIQMLIVTPDAAAVLHTAKKARDHFLLKRDRSTLTQLDEVELYVTDFEFAASRLIALANNAIKVVDVNNAEVLAEAQLLNRPYHWCGAESLAICHEHHLAAFILRETFEEGPATFELQVWRLFPLERIAALPLPEFASSREIARGGLVFAHGRLIVVGETSNLSIEYSVG